MTIILATYVDVLELERQQVDAGYWGQPELPDAELESEWNLLREDAHRAVFGPTVEDVMLEANQFVRTFKPPQTPQEAMHYAEKRQFDISNSTGGALRDWFWHCVMIGACNCNQTMFNRLEIEKKKEEHIMRKLGVSGDPWLRANDRLRHPRRD